MYIFKGVRGTRPLKHTSDSIICCTMTNFKQNLLVLHPKGQAHARYSR